MNNAQSLMLASMLALSATVSAQTAAPAATPARPAPAQAATQQPLTPAQQAQVKRQDEEMGRAALQVAQLVDQNKMTEVWDGASSVAKGVVTRDDFVRQIAADRQKLGAPAARQQVGVTRAAYAAGGQVPAGNYINVVYATKFANAEKPVRELVSFHLDDDKTWRVSGYSLR